MSWGVVFSGCGVLGAAWTVGALTAWMDQTGRDPREADLLLGNSGGALLAALLGEGVSVGELRDHHLGRPVRTGSLSGLGWDYDRATGGLDWRRPRMGVGAWALATQRDGHRRMVPPSAVVHSLLPEGKGRLETVGSLLTDLQAARAAGPDSWSAHPGVRIVATDYLTGDRTRFGDPDGPQAGLADAVMASCALPGWYSPVAVGGRQHIDGGAASATNLDLVLADDLDEVVVFAPMASFVDPLPPVLHPVDQAWRRRVTAQLLRETHFLQHADVEVTLLVPGAGDLLALGADLTDLSRRRTVLETATRNVGRLLADPTTRLRDERRLSGRLTLDVDNPDDPWGGEELPHRRPAEPKPSPQASAVKQSEPLTRRRYPGSGRGTIRIGPERK